MSKLTTVFEDYDDAQLIDFCISTLNSNSIWRWCVTIDDSTGDTYDQDCEERLQQLIDWASEFYEVDMNTLTTNGLSEIQPDSYTSAYETENGVLILIQSHNL